MNAEAQYGIGSVAHLKTIPAPEYPYLPRDPKTWSPGIALIGCGGISEYHLREYKKAGYRVLALCDSRKDRAEKRREEFFPDATVTDDYTTIFERDDIDVIDAATHPEERVGIIREALCAGKHVLSQKPFVTDLDEGEQLVELAKTHNRKLAVNQNGRWAPHYSYLRHAVAQGLAGELASITMSVHWDHSWTADTPFNDIRHLILYDFAIHWFDIVRCFAGNQNASSVHAVCMNTATQRPAPPMLAQISLAFEHTLATLAFNGDTHFAPHDQTILVGSRGTLISQGKDLLEQSVQVATSEGIGVPTLEGNWFENGFHGTMAELLCAIEENREPTNSAANNLASLELCFAAVASAESGSPVVPGTVRCLPESS